MMLTQYCMNIISLPGRRVNRGNLCQANAETLADGLLVLLSGPVRSGVDELRDDVRLPHLSLQKIASTSVDADTAAGGGRFVPPKRVTVNWG